MKTQSILTSILLVLAGLVTTAFGQLPGPPGLVDYQGRLLNASGGPLTSAGGPGTTGVAANFVIHFRIWDEPEAGTLVWAERQVVTVDQDGLFSVRLGEGEVITVANSDPLPLTGQQAGGAGMLNVFGTDNRYLGLTVINPPAIPGEIQPRLAFLSAPYAIEAGRAQLGPSTGAFFAEQIAIGRTSSPAVLLQVDQPVINEATLGDNTGMFMVGNQDGDNLVLDNDEIQARANGSPGSLILNEEGGNVGIGTAIPSQKLHVVGDAGKTVGGTSWVNLSDRRLKKDVQDYRAGLQEIMKLRPVRFRYKDDTGLGLSSGDENIGFIAQEVRDVIPEAVSKLGGAEATDDAYLQINVDPIHWAAVNAIKELKTAQDMLTAALQKENSALRDRLEALEAKDAARDAKLAAIEEILRSGEASGTRQVGSKRTVSAK